MPKPPEPAGRQQQAKQDRRTRAQRYADEDLEPEMPHLTARRLIAHLMDVGPVLSGGMGPVPITYSEIDAWQRTTRMRLTPGEAQLLRTLSREYLTEMLAAEEPQRPQPYLSDGNKRLDRILRSRALKASMRRAAAVS